MLKALDTEIIEVTPEEGLEEEIGQSDEYKERLYEALTHINKALDSTCTTAATPSPKARTTEPMGEKTAKIKLPKLSLSHFNGDLTKWTTFWDSYESAVHSNHDLSDIETRFGNKQQIISRNFYRRLMLCWTRT